MERKIHYISPKKLTYPIIEDILEDHKMLVLSEESVALINKSKAYLDRKISETNGPLYGINTGFGALCNIEVVLR
jgi:histidine ammonia-lyase